MAGKKPQTHTAPDLRLTENKKKYGTVENRDRTAPRGKLNPAKQSIPTTETPIPVQQPPTIPTKGN